MDLRLALSGVNKPQDITAPADAKEILPGGAYGQFASGFLTGIGGTMMFVGVMLFFIVVGLTVAIGRRTAPTDVPVSATLTAPARSGRTPPSWWPAAAGRSAPGRRRSARPPRRSRRAAGTGAASYDDARPGVVRAGPAPPECRAGGQKFSTDCLAGRHGGDFAVRVGTSC